jgi:hypothetical protein
VTFPSIDRHHAATLFFGALLFVLTLAIVGAGVALVTQPAIRFLRDAANAWVTPGAAVVNLLSVATAYFLLGRAHTMSAARAATIWSRNSEVFAAALLVAIVYLALIPVNLLVGELRAFLEIQGGNTLQIDMSGGTGLLFTTLVLPLAGILLVLLIAPRLTGRTG